MHEAPSLSLVETKQFRWRRARRWRTWIATAIIAATVLILAAVGGRSITRGDSDLPTISEFIHDAEHIYAPDMPGISGWHAITHDHLAVGRFAKQTILQLNGQTDARLLQYASLLLQLGTIGFVLILLRRILSLTTLTSLAVIAMVLPFTPAVLALSPTDTFGVSAAVFLSLAHFVLALRSRPGTARWWCGIVLGAVAILASTAGLASAAALIAEALFKRRLRGPLRPVAERVSVSPVSRKPHGFRYVDRPGNLTLFANSVLFGAGLLLVGLRVQSGAKLSAGLLVMSWPFGHPIAAILLWAPSLLCIAASVVGRGVRSDRLVLVTLAGWAVATIGLFAAMGVEVASALPMLSIGILVNVACLAAFVAKGRSAATKRFVFAGGWALVIGTALIESPANGDDHPKNISTILARVVREHDSAAIEELDVTDSERQAISELITRPAIQRILPASIRAPLKVEPAAETDSHAFRPDAAPKLEERESLPVLGTWSNEGSSRTGDFVSGPLTSSFPFLQFRIGGTLRPPATSIALHADDGPIVTPLTGPLSPLTRWRRVNFAVPSGTFRIVAETRNSTEWIAFTAPVEVGALTRIVTKIPRSWPKAPLWVGTVLAAIIGIVLAGRASLARRLPRIDWRVVPWVALFGYTLYFAQHTDPTAGPNDSGGYLNSAKLIVGGHVTAESRRIFPAAPGEDITPYLPITFHAKADRMVPEYPVGWPLEVAAFGKVFGLTHGVSLLIVVQLVLGVWITQRLGRIMGLSAPWAWLAAGIVSVSPAYLFEALQPVSDGPALLWVTLAVCWAWQSRETPAYAIWSGLATALAVMIRPSNLLCVAPIAICVAGSWRRMVYWAVAGSPGAAFLAYYQQALYGNWHTTGYGNISDGFGLHFAPLTMRAYAVWLPEFLTPIVVLVVALPFIRSVPGKVRVLLTTWVAIFIAFYAVYWCTWDSWFNMRFVLPAFPPMIVGALLVAREITVRLNWPLFASRSTARGLTLSALVTAVLLGFVALRTVDRDVTYWMRSNHKPRIAAEWVRDHVPSDAVVFAKHLSGSLFYYSELAFVRLDHPRAQQPELFEQIAQTGRPIYALTCHWETRDYHWESGHNGSGYPDLPGKWERIALLCEGDMMVWRRVPDTR
jgi:hypothetical protein